MVVLRRDQSSARLRQVLGVFNQVLIISRFIGPINCSVRLGLSLFPVSYLLRGLDYLHLVLVSWSLLLLAGLLLLLLPMLMLRARIPGVVLCQLLVDQAFVEQARWRGWTPWLSRLCRLAPSPLDLWRQRRVFRHAVLLLLVWFGSRGATDW